MDFVQDPRHRQGAPTPRAFAFALVGVLASGCAGDIDDGRTDAESDPLHLGRVHVLVEPGDAVEDNEDSAAFEVTARFAFVRGFDEDVARARIDMAVMPHEVLRPGECVPSDQLVTPVEMEGDGSDVQELVLLDAGDLQVSVGDEHVRVPLSLVPDLLPYMSGVEYLYYADEVPNLGDEARDLSVTASGSVTDELPPFSAGGTVPAPLDLGATDAEIGALDQDALALHWRAGDDVLTLRIAGMVRGEVRGSELTCVVSDQGAVRLHLPELRTFGLAPDADAYRISASRMHATTFEAGDFGGSELLIERREQFTLLR